MLLLYLGYTILMPVYGGGWLDVPPARFRHTKFICNPPFSFLYFNGLPNVRASQLHLRRFAYWYI